MKNQIATLRKGRTEMGIIILLSTMAIFLFIGSPVVVALGASSLIYFLVVPGKFAYLGMYSELFFNGMNSFLFLCIPLFILAGAIMQKNKMIDEIVDFANLLVGRLRGGLAYMTIVACMLMGGISGSALAELSAIGPVSTKAMKDQGYPPVFAAAITAVSSLQGPIIPPSLPMIIYASVTGTSVGALFLGGAIPGLLLGLGLMVVVAFQAKRRNFPKSSQKRTLKEIGRIIFNSLTSILMPVIIIGGIISGAFTPTESAAIAVAYAVIVTYTVAIKKNPIGFADWLELLASTARTTSQLYLIIGFALLLSWIFAIENIPSMITNLVTSYHMPVYLLLLVVNVIFLINGCFISDVLQIVLFAPIFAPIFQSMGIHPVQFGVMMVLNVIMGMVTPPYGTGLYLAAAVGKVGLKELVRETIPMICSSIVVLFITAYVPWVVLFLPRLLGWIQ
jgi:TRAP-type transport system large permease protein